MTHPFLSIVAAKATRAARCPRRVTPLLLAFLLAAGCSKDADQIAERLPETLTVIKGKVVTRVDDAPFSYLKVKVERDMVWVGVPVGSRGVGDQVLVTECVVARNLMVRAAGGRLPVVYLGTLRD